MCPFIYLKEDSDILDSVLWSKLFRLCQFSKDQNWKLVYRGSKDSFGADNFHRLCDRRSKTVTVIKTTNGNIFGGYTEKSWDSSNIAYIDANAFIFSLVNLNNHPFVVMSKNGKGSIHGCSIFGPTFGSTGAYDIIIAPNSNTNRNSYSRIGQSYQHPDYPYGSEQAKTILGGTYYFQTTEIEVFRIIQ